MITLNLVSLEQKKEIKLRHIYGLVKKSSLAILAVTFVTAVVLISAKMILQSEFNDVISQTSQNTETNEQYASAKSLNNKLNFVETIQEKFIPWSVLIKKIADITPDGINFYYIKMDAGDGTIKIRGKAKQRSSLLKFKDNMADSNYFYDIDFPIKNILEKENIDFEIKAKLDLSLL